MEIKFSSDTKYRKEWLTGLHFAHPAKMHLSLQLWLIDRYTKEGEVILDPMAGSGTILVACSTGRNVICVELEDKFIKMMDGNWKKIQQRGPQLGYKMGWAKILQGDARKLPDVLADAIISSPPYAEAKFDCKHGIKGQLSPNLRGRKVWEERFDGNPQNPDNISNLPYGKLADVIMTSPPYAIPATSQQSSKLVIEDRIKRGIRGAVIKDGEYHTGDGKREERYSDNPENLASLPYGSIDAVISSPPYEEAMGEKHHSPRADKLAEEKSNPVTYTDRVDCVISSPPYENAVHKQDEGHPDIGGGQRKENFQYAQDESNIGNLKGQSYLSAMLEVYQGCWRVLKPQGLMILVTKNFIRNKQEIRLDFDTIRLCEQAGFRFAVRHYRKLTSQSFWRTIYQQKYPDAPILDKEDILVFQK